MTVSPDSSDVVYRPFGTNNGNQEYNVYTPQSTHFTQPGAGWPCVIYVNLSSWTTSTRPATITGFKERVTQWGMALVDMTCTTDGLGVGNGLFRNPGSSDWDTDDSPEHDLVWCLQHVRDNASTYNIDPNNVGFYAADTEASTIALFVALLEDQIDSLGIQTMLRESSVPESCCVRTPTAWWRAMDDTDTVAGHLPDSTLPETVASTYGDVTTPIRTQASPLYRPAISSTPPYMPIRIGSSGSPTSTNFRTSGANNAPVLTDTLTAEDDPWHQIMVMEWLRKFVSPTIHGRSKLANNNIAAIEWMDEINADLDQQEAIELQFMADTLATDDGSVGTFPVPYEWAAQMETSARLTQSSVSDGVSQGRRTQSSASRSSLATATRAWKVQWSLLTEAEATSLDSFVDTAVGTSLPFEFSPPDQPGSVLCRFRDDTLRLINIKHDRYQGEAIVEEFI